jgi:hypothetical protein
MVICKLYRLSTFFRKEIGLEIHYVSQQTLLPYCTKTKHLLRAFYCNNRASLLNNVLCGQEHVVQIVTTVLRTCKQLVQYDS